MPEFIPTPGDLIRGRHIIRGHEVTGRYVRFFGSRGYLVQKMNGVATVIAANSCEVLAHASEPNRKESKP